MIWTCNRGHACLEAANRECPWCRVEELTTQLAEVVGALSYLRPEVEFMAKHAQWPQNRESANRLIAALDEAIPASLLARRDREQKILAMLYEPVCNACQVMDGFKSCDPENWSPFDQETRDGLTEILRALDALDTPAQEGKT